MGRTFDLAEISFFELDRLFTQSHKAIRRKQLRRRRKDRKDGESDNSSPERSRSPPRRGQLRIGGRVLPQTGGFTDKVEKLERCIVVTGVPLDADEKIIFKHFSKCGLLIDVQCVRNPRGERTGVCIVEFAQEDPATRAAGLPAPFNEILGQPVQAKKGDAQVPKINPAPKRPLQLTRQQFTQSVLTGIKTGGAEVGPNMRKLHIKNLRAVVRDEDMRGIFKPFGEFEEFQMGTQECWITFVNSNDAQDAMSSMQGFQLVGQELQIVLLTVTPKSEAPPPEAPKAPERMDMVTDSDFGATGSTGTNVMNRIELMKKLIGSHAKQGVPTVIGLAAPIPGAATAPPVAAAKSLSDSLPPAPKPGSPTSRTLLLQNMYTSTGMDVEKEPKFYDDIREDTHDECAKFGKVSHITVDPRGTQGLIYVWYETPQQRMAGELALNGRWFEGKKIVAMGIDDSIWQELAAQTQAATA